MAYDVMGEMDRAIEDFDAAIRLYPDHSATYIHRGLARVKKRDFKHAVDDFSEAIRCDPNHAFLALNDRANAHEAVGEYDQAIEDYGRAIEIDPSYAPAYYNRAGVYYAKAIYDRAIEDYGRAIQLKPGVAQAYNNRGVVYRAKGSIDNAIADFDVAIRLDPTDAAVLGNRGSAYAAEGQFEQAVADFSSAIKLAPGTARFYVHRGRAKLYLKQTEAAIEDLATAIRLRPSDAYAVIWLHLAHVQNAAHDLHELERNSANVDRETWPGPVVDLHLGVASPETVATVGLSNVDAKVRPERACEVAFYLGTFYLEQRDWVEAKRRLQAAVDQCPPSLIELGAAKAELAHLESTR
jgi:tetratricopeptide (TPR) repeat protein